MTTYKYYRIAVTVGELLNLKEGTIVVGRSQHWAKDTDWLWVLEKVKK